MNREGQKIIEIAIINFDANTFQVEDTFSTLINPEKNISYQIEMITGINDSMVINAPKFYEVAKKIIEMTEGRIFVAHNVFFDYRFIQREFNELGFSFKREVFCTCKSSRKVFTGLASYSLKNLCNYFGIIQKEAHRALSDAENALEILKKILKSDKDISSLQNDDHLIPAQLSHFQFNNFPESYGLYFMYSETNELLYVGKSKNIRSRLKQHFKQLKGERRERNLKSEVTRVDYLECYDDLPTSLLELHFIKTLRPKYNRAQRKKVFRYGVKKSFNEKGVLEIKPTTHVLDLPIQLTFGSRIHAERFVEKIYENLFGIKLSHPMFHQQINLFIKTLGADKFNEKLNKTLSAFEQSLEDQVFQISDKWSLEISDNKLIKIYLEGSGTFLIDETPDMRAHLIKKMK